MSQCNVLAWKSTDFTYLVGSYVWLKRRDGLADVVLQRSTVLTIGDGLADLVMVID